MWKGLKKCIIIVDYRKSSYTIAIAITTTNSKMCICQIDGPEKIPK